MQTEFLKNCVKGLLISIGAAAVLILVFGWVCTTQEDPDAMIGILGRAALYLGAFAGGFAASRFNRGMGLVSGAATGGAFMLIVVVLSLILRDGQEPMSFLTWVMFLFVALVGTAGGYLGIPSGKKKKRKKRRGR